MSVFQFKATRPYLRHYIAHLPRKGWGEVTRIASHLSVSTTFVSQVLAGDLSFTPEQAQRLAGYLGLTGLEADYFIYLVHFERAGTADLKNYWRAKLEELHSRSLKISTRLTPKRVLTDHERAVFYSTPLYSAIQLFTGVGEKGKSGAEIGERFELARAKATEIIHFLVEIGLCEERSGRYFPGTQSTHLEKGSPHMLRHHSNWRLQAIRQCEDLADQELMYTAQVSLSRGDFDLLREEMVGFIKRFLERVHASPAEDIACFNMDFFWIKK
jgi:uncharacterized protein (TIGR02147 family)